MNKALAFFMGTDCGGGRCEKCEGVFVQPRGMPLNPNPPSLGEGGPWFFGLLFATPTTRSSIYIHLSAQPVCGEFTIRVQQLQKRHP